MTITEFLTARYEEEEHDWRVVAAREVVEMLHGRPLAPMMLADIAAKRAIVALHQPKRPADTWHWLTRECAGCGGRWHKWVADRPPTEIGPEQGCQTIRLLAQPYSAHPDFDPEWRVG